MAFNIVRNLNQGIKIGDDITIRYIKNGINEDGIMLSIDAPYGQRIERLENLEAGFTTSVEQNVSVSSPDRIMEHVKEVKRICDTKERRRLMLRALPDLAKLTDEACDAMIMLA